MEGEMAEAEKERLAALEAERIQQVLILGIMCYDCY
jgi:hypothetical protein